MAWDYDYYDDWRPYVTVGARRHQAAKRLAELKKAGRKVAPVEVAGRKIATTFWGDAWCKNLEAYSDYANRLPRGRSYVRHGAVIDLTITAKRVRALVSGSEIYDVELDIKPLARTRWKDIKRRCAGQIDSLVELLRGSISKRVMAVVTEKGAGLFPAPREISLRCSCPDWAVMCKHVAATLYGVGARLDHAPDLLFTLRGVDPLELVEMAIDQPSPRGKPRKGRGLKANALSSIFGVDIDTGDTGKASTRTKPAKRKKRTAQTRKKTTPQTKKAKTKKAAKAKKANAKKTAKAKKLRRATTKKGKSAGKKPANKSVSKKHATKKTARKAATKKTATRKRATQKATRKAATKTRMTKTTATKLTGTKKRTTKKAAGKKAPNKKTATRKRATNKPAANKPAAKRARKKAGR